LVKKKLYDGNIVKDVGLSSKDMVKEQLVFDRKNKLLYEVIVVEKVVCYEGKIVKDKLWYEGKVVGVNVKSGVKCNEVGN
jgi:hypothetical protein